MTGFGRVLVPGMVAAIVSLAVVAPVPARAQDNHIQRYGEPDKELSATEKAAKKDADRAYEKSLSNIPSQKATDPWGIARTDEAPKAATKAATPKPKAKSATAADAKATDTKTTGATKQ